MVSQFTALSINVTRSAAHMKNLLYKCLLTLLWYWKCTVQMPSHTSLILRIYCTNALPHFSDIENLLYKCLLTILCYWEFTIQMPSHNSLLLRIYYTNAFSNSLLLRIYYTNAFVSYSLKVCFVSYSQLQFVASSATVWN